MSPPLTRGHPPCPPHSYIVAAGHSRGSYLYYYTPQPKDKKRYTVGWCVSDYLGNGDTTSRVMLPDSDALAPSLTRDGDTPADTTRTWKQLLKSKTRGLKTITKYRPRRRGKDKGSASVINPLSLSAIADEARPSADSRGDVEDAVYFDLREVALPQPPSLLGPDAGVGSGIAVVMVDLRWCPRAHHRCLLLTAGGVPRDGGTESWVTAAFPTPHHRTTAVLALDGASAPSRPCMALLHFLFFFPIAWFCVICLHRWRYRFP